jgi:hypothetical protein
MFTNKLKTQRGILSAQLYWLVKRKTMDITHWFLVDDIVISLTKVAIIMLSITSSVFKLPPHLIFSYV